MRQETIRGQWDSEGYLDLYPDVRAAGVDAWEHFKVHGCKESRQIAIRTPEGDIIQGDFNAVAYVQAYPDLIQARVEGWTHYSNHGHGELRDAFVTLAAQDDGCCEVEASSRQLARAEQAEAEAEAALADDAAADDDDDDVNENEDGEDR